MSVSTIAQMQQVIQNLSQLDTQGNTQTYDPANYLVQAPAGPRCARGPVRRPRGRARTERGDRGCAAGGRAEPRRSREHAR